MIHSFFYVMEHIRRTLFEKGIMSQTGTDNTTESVLIEQKTYQNPWLEHVRKFRSQNPDKSYKDALMESRKTYTPQKSKENIPPGERKPNPWMEHINKFKAENPDWKDNYSYKQVLQKLKETYKTQSA